MNIDVRYGLPFVKIGEISLATFEVEIGEMNYGMEIDGILGFDFISAAGLVIDSKALTIAVNLPVSGTC